jgi:TnpA family transposase
LAGDLPGGARTHYRCAPRPANRRRLGDGTTSSSDRQFFRSARRGDAAGEVNARYGAEPGVGFYTHVSDQHGPYSSRIMSATSHEAPYVLDGLLHHGTSLRINTHFTDTGGASDHVFILCSMLGIQFCPRLRDFADRRLAVLEPTSTYGDLAPLLGRRVKVEVIREHWGEVLRLVSSLRAGTVLPSAMLKKLAAYQRQNQLDLALQELGASSGRCSCSTGWNPVPSDNVARRA